MKVFFSGMLLLLLGQALLETPLIPGAKAGLEYLLLGLMALWVLMGVYLLGAELWRWKSSRPHHAGKQVGWLVLTLLVAFSSFVVLGLRDFMGPSVASIQRVAGQTFYIYFTGFPDPACRVDKRWALLWRQTVYPHTQGCDANTVRILTEGDSILIVDDFLDNKQVLKRYRP